MKKGMFTGALLASGAMVGGFVPSNQKNNRRVPTSAKPLASSPLDELGQNRTSSYNATRHAHAKRKHFIEDKRDRQYGLFDTKGLSPLSSKQIQQILASHGKPQKNIFEKFVDEQKRKLDTQGKIARYTFLSAKHKLLGPSRKHNGTNTTNTTKSDSGDSQLLETGIGVNGYHGNHTHTNSSSYAR